MLQDMIHPPEQQLPIEDIPSPISGPNFYLSDNDFFSDALQNSEVTDENSSYGNNLNIPPDIEQLNGYHNNNNRDTNSAPTTAAVTATSASNTATSTTAATSNNNNLSIIFDSPDDISASIDFSESPSFAVPPFLTHQNQFDLSMVQSQIQLSDVSAEGPLQYATDTVGPLLGPPLSSVFDEDCLSSVPSYFWDFADRILLNSELQPQDLEFQGDNGGIFCHDSVQRVFKPGELQGLSSDNQQLVGVATTSSTPLASENSSLEDSSFNKVGKLSVEQRKEKIHRYMKKRNERNFSKKSRQACSNHEEENDDEVVVKEEEDMVDSSDIFAHISGVNSFKCNYPIQSWI
ncbi:MOS4-associated complex 3A [Hibiscus syriacus]|uniref:MOS4-associated complex 3A n=1 Tax=Hibiscus syriacus TaxID=106335 RepID=A0A6A2WKF4_HIBSY|nr:MOS4-associated complex 3A [Hibiscus syriacus]